DTLSAGEALSGKLWSRFADARVLLTVRDSRGYRLWQTVTLEKGAASFRLDLPPDLRYGCTLEGQYCDSPLPEAPIHVASSSFHVEPAGKLLTVQTKMKSTVAPGDKVSIDVQVNRAEEVDLVVSVYDEMLLALKPDRSADVRSFYLADERVKGERGLDLLR